MSKITTAIDYMEGQIVTDVAFGSSYSCDLIATNSLAPWRATFAGLTFGVRATVGETVLIDQTWPPSGTSYLNSDQPILQSVRIDWEPDQIVNFEAFIEDYGYRFTKNFSVTVPRPAKPYPSWVWDGAAWAAPEPFPNDGAFYWWDESETNWVAA
jgi:hypothetical protein